MEFRGNRAWVRAQLSGSAFLCGYALMIAYDAVIPSFEASMPAPFSSAANAMDLCMLAGMLLVAVAPAQAEKLGRSPRMLVAACALGAVGTLLLTDNDYRTSWGTIKPESEHSVSRFYWSLPDSCTRAAQRYGLTRREEDVLMLLAQRKTDAEIAGELFVSASTVKSHCKSIYRKMNIHKREEVLRRLGYDAERPD